jgi:hypothetical protein
MLPLTLPVMLPVTLPVMLPVTLPVMLPIKLSVTVEPQSMKQKEKLCPLILRLF